MVKQAKEAEELSRKLKYVLVQCMDGARPPLARTLAERALRIVIAVNE